MQVAEGNDLRLYVNLSLFVRLLDTADADKAH